MIRSFRIDAIASLKSCIFGAHDRRFPSIFPELAPLDCHNDDTGLSATLGPQEDFNEAFDYGDDEVELMPDLHATVAEVPVSQDDLTDHSLKPDASVLPDLENAGKTDQF